MKSPDLFIAHKTKLFEGGQVFCERCRQVMSIGGEAGMWYENTETGETYPSEQGKIPKCAKQCQEPRS